MGNKAVYLNTAPAVLSDHHGEQNRFEISGATQAWLRSRNTPRAQDQRLNDGSRGT